MRRDDGTGVSVVIPTLGRASLQALIAALGAADRRSWRGPVQVLVVDDRRAPEAELDPLRGAGRLEVTVLRGRGAGPAAARNVGWRAAAHDWVVFLDDDVLPADDWWSRLADDLTTAAPHVGGVQGRVRVPLSADRRPTDWQRCTAALAHGRWITADMAYRREALAGVGGFDERLPRAFREDAELAYRVQQAGWTLLPGGRAVTHPVRPESRWVSVRTQRGNADDALLRRLYGPRWRALLDIPTGRRTRHLAITAAAVAALGLGAVAVSAGDRRLARVAGLAAGAWAAGAAEFAAARIAPGPRERRELVTMLLTSLAIPPVATACWLAGWLRWRGASPMPIVAHRPALSSGGALRQQASVPAGGGTR
ncbi:MAG TPA: glycosyltransferase [Actinoplanes sp.]|nr:glycosyltransferase [Actinoplanes sp.]